MSHENTSILIVEDDELSREGLALLLGLEYTCFAAASAEEAMRLLAARHFNLVITDLHMSGASGLEVCRFVQRLSRATPVIVLSGMTDIRFHVEALRQGTLYYIEKPVDTGRLLALVKSALKCESLATSKHL